MPLTKDFLFKCSTCGAEVDAVTMTKRCCAQDFHRRFAAGEFDEHDPDLHRFDDDGGPAPTEKA